MNPPTIFAIAVANIWMFYLLLNCCFRFLVGHCASRFATSEAIYIRNNDHPNTMDAAFSGNVILSRLYRLLTEQQRQYAISLSVN